MKRFDLVIRNPTGLHARPARTFVDAAKRFRSSIRVGHGDKLANGKSLTSLLTLGIRSGQTISITIEGTDELTAADALRAAVHAGLGEAPCSPAAVPVPALGPSLDAWRPAACRRAAGNLDHLARRARMVTGVPGAPGIVVAPVHQFRHVEISVREAYMGAPAEEARLRSALDAARVQLATLQARMAGGRAGGESMIFAVHADILRDPELLAQVQVNIEVGHSAAEAWQAVIEERARELRDHPNEMEAERASDVRDVGERVLRLLVGLRVPTAPQPDKPYILVGHDLRPSDAAMLDPERVLGFCTAAGGRYAHTAILARALGITAVVSAGPEVLDFPDGTNVILDGRAGTIALAPDGAQLTRDLVAAREAALRRTASDENAGALALTRDGHRVAVCANVGSVADAHAAAAAGAEGVGLLRTEFLFLSRGTPPQEEEQLAVYREVLRALDNRPVVIRTLDAGGDRCLPYLPLPRGDNPSLGERGVRLWRAHADLVRIQIRAILHASTSGPVRIMLPMITDVAEFRVARWLIETIRAELGIPTVQIGAIVEVPSAAIMAPLLAADVDFLSIGTNDLTQYTLAMDRTHPALSADADGLHPAVLRLIEGTVRAARSAGKPVSICGELGADPDAIPILIGLGVEQLSVSIPCIPFVKDQIRSLDSVHCRRRALRALACETAREVRIGALPE
jgi:multiphosphoryl transfer protein